MTTNRTDDVALEDLVMGTLREPIPEELEVRLRERIHDARRQLPVRLQQQLSRRRFGGIALAAGLSAAAVATPFLYSGGPDAWAEVLKEIEDRPWIHFSGKHMNGMQFQFWVSFEHGIYAMKAGDPDFASIQNKKANTGHSYRSSEGVIRQREYRLPPGELGQLEALLNRMSAGEKTVEIAKPDEILEQSRREIVQDGEKLWEYEFTLKAFDEGHVKTYGVVFQVDPKTRLLRKWKRKSPDGKQELSFDIDYPSDGPKNIFDLGAPKTAKIVTGKK